MAIPVEAPPELPPLELEPLLLELELLELELLELEPLPLEPEPLPLELEPLPLELEVVVLGLELEFPPHETTSRQTQSSSTARYVEMASLERLFIKSNRTPPKMTLAASRGTLFEVVAAPLLMVRMELADPELSATLAGEKLQLAPVGKPEQDNETLPVNPPEGVTVSVVVGIVCPALTAAKLVLALKVKPDPAVPATVTVDAEEVLGA